MTDTIVKPVIEYYDDGKIKCAYSVDENGYKQGPYEKYHENGLLWGKGVCKMGERLYGEEAEEYLKEWNGKHIMAPTQLRQSIKRAEVAKFRKNHPDKHAGLVIEKKNWLQKLFRGGR